MPNRINELELSFVGTSTLTNGVPLELNIHTALSVCTCRAAKLNFWGTSVLTKRAAKLDFWGASAEPAQPSELFYQINYK